MYYLHVSPVHFSHVHISLYLWEYLIYLKELQQTNHLLMKKIKSHEITCKEYEEDIDLVIKEKDFILEKTLLLVEKVRQK